MSESKLKKSIVERLFWWGAHFCTLSGFALSHLFELRSESAPADQDLDPDFLGWLRNDPMVTENPANRYGKGARGYVTSNGRGSLEIGAVND